MTPLYHGLTARDAVLWIYARSDGATLITEATIRQWVHRGQVHRTQDGQIDPFTLDDWWTSRNAVA